MSDTASGRDSEAGGACTHGSPAFLVGAERSGTTLLRLILGAHADIAWLNEFEYAVDRIGQNDDWPDVSAYAAWLETHRVFRATGFTVDTSQPYPDIARSFLSQWQSATGRPIVGAAVHRHFDRLLRIWPEAKFIHMVRDGRDVARSRIGMGWAGNAWTGVRSWMECENLWDQVQARVPAGRRVEIRYEDLVTTPERSLQAICELLGTEFDDRMLAFEHPSYGPPDPSLAEQWRHRLSVAELQLVESRVADLLVDRGYELSGERLIRIGARPAVVSSGSRPLVSHALCTETLRPVSLDPEALGHPARDQVVGKASPTQNQRRRRHPPSLSRRHCDPLPFRYHRRCRANRTDEALNTVHGAACARRGRLSR